jgi:hypothetical protein
MISPYGPFRAHLGQVTTLQGAAGTAKKRPAAVSRSATRGSLGRKGFLQKFGSYYIYIIYI